jgi:hypothetical protein
MKRIEPKEVEQVGMATAEDLRKQVDRVDEALQRSDLYGLARTIARVSDANKQLVGRAPFALLKTEEDVRMNRGNLWFECFAQRPCRPTHIVLSESSAEAFDLGSIFIGTSLQGATLSDFQPGELFSVKYMTERKELAEVLSFRTDLLDPGCILRLQAALRPGMQARPFRGMLWLGYL